MIRQFLEGKEQKYQLCSLFEIFLGNHCKGNVVLDFSLYWYTLTLVTYLARWRHHQRMSSSLCLRLCRYCIMWKHFPSPEVPWPHLDLHWGRTWASTSLFLVPPKRWKHMYLAEALVCSEQTQILLDRGVRNDCVRNKTLKFILGSDESLQELTLICYRDNCVSSQSWFAVSSDWRDDMKSIVTY